jgi:hypothetical protein
MGLILLMVILLGLRAGFTGITYVLTLLALSLCATGGLSIFYALVFVPLYFTHAARMRHPLFVPPGLGRTGLVPLFGLVGLALNIVILVKVTRILGLVPVGATLVLVVTFVALLRKFRAHRDKKMLALLNTELGTRYSELLQRIGKLSALPVPTEDKLDVFSNLMMERESIERKIVAAGVDMNPRS